ncbi:cyclodeaminase/cyclohydrolase family protein [Kitasatospora sp. NPDC004799]|uniref:cyclodeaminase/cyclohydrolase family protein n=1 Tax=Kitasatospora sp. NPDC004799 TaxID=3154460 RepID=UPI0033A71138
MQTQPVGGWLDDLASGSSTPGGGAAAAMNAAVGAALISMVCNLTIGRPKYAAYEAELTAALKNAEELRGKALELAADDAVAFAAVIAAYQLPKGTDADKRARTAAIQTALVGAAEVPLRTAELAAEVVRLSRAVLPGANVNVVSDVAVAASSARAALDAAVVNVEVNLAALTDEEQRAALRGRLAAPLAAAAEADAVVAEVRERIAK